MDTKTLEKFAQAARRQLQQQVTARLDRVLKTDTGELRARSQAVTDLKQEIKDTSRQAVIEQVAYTWFNRFIALRYMDANHYTRVGVVSPAAGFTQPEILQSAKQGIIDDDLPLNDRQRVLDLLGGRLPASDPQQEAYRLLLVAACNQYHRIMPFMFEEINDYTELLMPDDLLSTKSVLHAAREVLTPEACQDVEVIGWLYQFYISEKKDAVIKSKKKITPENIPAATQLFTPHWIVRYLVENSLGRLWLLNRPHSRLADRMEYYIRPEQAETDFLRIDSPEELRLCDPAAGSGHMLTYAFDLLYAIYEEEGYNAIDIPRLILQKNLYGMEIDERAGALAAFALVMKAREKDRRFFRRERETGGIQPHIMVLRPIDFKDKELDEEVARLAPVLAGEWQEPGQQMSLLGEEQKQLSLSGAEGMQALREALHHDLNLFAEADNVGSLLRPQLAAGQLAKLRRHVEASAATGQLQMFDEKRRQQVLRALAQAEMLARKYHVVVANPPYMGSRNMNGDLKKFAKRNYKNSKSDLFAMFIERGLNLILKKGFSAMVTMQSWMFLSSYEKLRKRLLKRTTIECMVHMDNMVMGIAFGTAATVWQKFHKPDYKGHFSYVYYEDLTEENKPQVFPVQNERLARATAVDFQKIPGSPIAYWLKGIELFDLSRISKYFVSAGRNKTHNNEQYLRFFWEVPASSDFWASYANGGEFRKYFGNEVHVVNWSPKARDFYNSLGGLYNSKFWGKEGITWSKITSSNPSFRVKPSDSHHSSSGLAIVHEEFRRDNVVLAYLNSPITRYFLKAFNPTLTLNAGDVLSLPYPQNLTSETISINVEKCISNTKLDWDSYESSRDFTNLQLFHLTFRHETLAATYIDLRINWLEMTLEIEKLEEKNNHAFIKACNLQDELTPDVPLAEITLTCNPHYRYGSSHLKKRNWAAFSEQFPTAAARLTALSADMAPDMPEEDRLGLEQRLLDDTMREFISYAVGCMFGRYSLDKPGLILANQGETLADYLAKVSLPAADVTFVPDKDNAIPMLDGDWFSDDVTERFKKFLRLTFGEEHYADNLAFIEAAIGRDIRSYFLRDFYDDHVKMYKKRHIYWLFSSPKGSFNVLIYMHRYRPDTISVILNDYLRNFRDKLNATRSHLQRVERSATVGKGEKTRAVKEISQIDKILVELREYEDDVLYPLATQQVQIDLDDGVKVNYNKFGQALKKVRGLSN